MRLFEVDTNVTAQDVYDLIHRDCQPYLAQNRYLPKTNLFRGMQSMTPFQKLSVGTSRMPRNTNASLHYVISKQMALLGFTANRDNSIFCTGQLSQAEYYGNVYNVYPIGDFSFTWSASIGDLYDARMKILLSTIDKTGLHKLLKHYEKVWSDNFYQNMPFYLGGYVGITDNLETDEQRAIFKKKIFNLFKILKPEAFDGFRYGVLSMIKNTNLDLGAYIDKDLLQKYLKANYSNTDLLKAIQSHNEIMIACNEYYAIRHNNKLGEEVDMLFHRNKK